MDNQKAPKKNIFTTFKKFVLNKLGLRVSRAEMLKAIEKYNPNSLQKYQPDHSQGSSNVVHGANDESPRQINQTTVELENNIPLTENEEKILKLLKNDFKLDDRVAAAAVRVIHGTARKDDIENLKSHDIYVYARKSNKHPDTEKITLLFRHKGLGNGGFGQVHRSVSLKGEKVIKIGLQNGRNVQEISEAVRMDINVINQIKDKAALVGVSKKKLSDCFVLGKECTDKGHANKLGLGIIMPRADNDLRIMFNSKLSNDGEKAKLIEQKADYVKGILEAGRLLHQLGFIHCDLKPDNVFLHEGKAKLADFGLTKVADEVKPGVIDGTEAYLPPEIRACLVENEGVEHVKMGREADCYAIGVIIFEMILGEQFESGSFGDPDFNIETNKVQLFRKNLEKMEPKNVLVDIQMGLLDPNPNTRMTLEKAVEKLNQLTTEEIAKYIHQILIWQKGLVNT